jgi:hypothetical protein
MAMPNAVKLFPRGYSGGQAQSRARFTERGGDEEISALWERYTSPLNQSTQWSFRAKVIGAAKRLLSGNRSWFLSQDQNPYVAEYNYQFVIDTLRFIATGRRRLSVHAWRDLVSHAPASGLASVEERHAIADAFETFKLNTSVDQLLQLWLAQPGGFDDLINTLNILFGDIHIRVDHDA